MTDIREWLASQGDPDEGDGHEDLEPPEPGDPLYAIYVESEEDEESPCYARRIVAWGEDSGSAYVQFKLPYDTWGIRLATKFPRFLELCDTEDERVSHYKARLMDETEEGA